MRARIEIECETQEELEQVTARLSSGVWVSDPVQLPLFDDKAPPEPQKAPPQSTGQGDEGLPPVTPSVMAKAKELGVDGRLADIPRSGKNGRMTQGDVIEFAKLHGAGAAPPPETEPEPAPESDPFDEEDPFNEGATAGPKIPATVKDLQDAFRELDKVRGTQTVLDILARFGVKKIHQIPEAQWGDVVGMINAAKEGVVI